MDMLAQAIDWNRIGEISRDLGANLPKDVGVAAVWPMVVLLVASVFIGLYGERLTRVLVLGVFIGLAALSGRWAAVAMALPLWPTVLLAAALGGIVAHLFYRWSLGLALATVLALAAAAWSTGTSLDASEIRGALSDLPGLVGVGEASPALPDQPGNLMHFLEKVQRQAIQVWEAMTTRPEAQKHLLITMLAGAAVGLLAGLVLGRLAAILWTSVLAAGGLLFAGISLAVWYQPQWGDYLSDNRQYVLMAGAAAALLFMLRQLARGRPATMVVVEAPAVASSLNKS
jgi:hypothetical protein